MISRMMTIEDMCRRLRPIFGKKIDELYLKYQLMDSKEAKMEIEQAVSALYQKHLTDSLLNEQVLLEPPKQGVVTGEYPLGTVIYSNKKLGTFGLREKDWMRHMCVTGMSGSGKTTFAFQILANFIIKKKPFLVFDWKKSFRPLMLLSDKLQLFTVGNEKVSNYKLNINEPPQGVRPKEWINLLADIITESYHASFGVHKLIVDTLDKAYTDFGVYAGSGNYPTWYQIKDRLEEKAANQTRKSRESEWLESTLRIAHSLTFGSFGEAICHKGAQTSDIASMFNQQVIFELASLSHTEKKFFCQFILSYIYKYAKAGNVNATESFRYAIVVDEAHNIFLKDKPNFISESISDVIFREIREYGVSLISLDQHISKLSDVVAGNSATNIAFQQILPDDIDAVSRLMQLWDKKDYYSKLPVGAAIVKLVERHQDPFIIQAPLMNIKNKTIHDEELAKRMKEITKEDKRREIFEQQCAEEALRKQIQKLERISISSNVKPDPQELERQARIMIASQAMQQAQAHHQQEQKDKDKPYGLTNHVQQKILDLTRKRLLNGEELEHIKRWFINEGYSRTDVLKVFGYMKRKGITTQLTKNLKEERVEITAPQVEFLKAVQAHPEMPMTALYKIAGLSPRKGNEIKTTLEDAGVIEVYDLRSEKGWTKHIRINYDEAITTLLSHTSQQSNTHTQEQKG